jgi:cathepsin B
MVDLINNMETTWKAGLNEGSSIAGATLEEVKGMMGSRKGGPQLPVKQWEGIGALPTSFNSITNWPFCPTIGQIRDQSACGSCWAFGAVEAISDRYCILMNKNLTISSADLAFCCDSCGDGCEGGYPSAAWQYWIDTGLVEEGCWPYPFPSCDHHVPGSKHPCPSGTYNNPSCPSSCKNPSWNGPAWSNDLHYGATAYSLQGEQSIMAEIFKNGPVETAFTVYEDFLSYKSGVYQHTSGAALGGHAVKFVGWGVEGGVKYWLTANSWNPTWGDKGFFKIIRGVDNCGIEDEVNGGTPKS